MRVSVNFKLLFTFLTLYLPTFCLDSPEDQAGEDVTPTERSFDDVKKQNLEAIKHDFIFKEFLDMSKIKQLDGTDVSKSKVNVTAGHCGRRGDDCEDDGDCCLENCITWLCW